MVSYKIVWKNSALKELKKLPREIIPKIISAVEQLVLIPYPDGVKKLVGSESTYRIRVGNYRIIYSVVSKSLLIEIVRVGDRKDVYRD